MQTIKRNKGFKTQRVGANKFAFTSATKIWMKRGALVLAVLALSFSSFTSVYADKPETDLATVDNGGGAVYDITCDDVSIAGDVWTFSGTWEVIDFQGQSTAYNVAMFAPTTAASATDASSKDAPDTFAITQGPGEFGGNVHNDDMAGTWSNQITFASAPASVSATLFHAQITGAESGDSTCSFSLPPTDTGTLTLIKALAGDDTLDVETDWTLDADGPSTINGATGDVEITNATVDAGEYTLNESGPTTGYTPSDWVCVDDADASVAVTNGNTVTVGANEEITCTITNTFDDGIVPADTSTLTLVKVLAGDDTSDVETAWALSAAGPTNTSGATGSAAVTAKVVTSGNYDLSESGPTTGYTPSAWVCMVDTDSVPVAALMVDSDTVTLSKDQDVTCTITNTFDDGGVVTFPFIGKVYKDDSPQDGNYDSETEDGLAGWTVYAETDDNNTLDEGEQNTLSDADGDYTLNLPAGCYTIREVLKSNWNQTEPDSTDNFEYDNVSVGGANCNVSLLNSITDLFSVKTAHAIAVVPTYNFGNVPVPTRHGGGGGGGSNNDGGQVLGETTSIPYQPQVLAAELPRTGIPSEALYLLLGLAGLGILPAFRRKLA